MRWSELWSVSFCSTRVYVYARFRTNIHIYIYDIYIYIYTVYMYISANIVYIYVHIYSICVYLYDYFGLGAPA